MSPVMSRRGRTLREALRFSASLRYRGVYYIIARTMGLAPATSAPAALWLAAVLACAPARTRTADAPGGDAPAADAPAQTFAVHGQFTYTEQSTSDFHAPYAGPNSLTPDTGAETIDATLFLGRRLWRDAEIWVSPEVDQGFGLDDTLGVAAFPSGEAYKIGKNQPYLRLQRAFVRQTVNLGDERETVEPDALQLGGTRSPDRLVFTVGKFTVPDLFD